MPINQENIELTNQSKVGILSWSPVKIFTLGGIILLIGALILAYFKLDMIENDRQELILGANQASNQNSRNNNENQNSVTNQSEPVKATNPTRAESKTMFFGDIIWSRYINEWSQASELKEAYPFSGLNSLEPGMYDIWIGNLECPVTTTRRTSAQEDAALKFSCDPKYLPEAAKYFKIFSLANNHTDNMQEVNGLKQTRDFLEQNNIQYFGHYDFSLHKDICEVVTLPINVYNNDQKLNSDELNKARLSTATGQTTETVQIPVAMCGYNAVFKLPTAADIAVIKQYSELMPTFVMPHQGVEYKLLPNIYQQNIYRSMIDNGADAVLGGHPHTVQPVENYKGKLIAYSMGNFIFDQQFSKDTTTGIGIGLNLNFKFNENLAKWVKLAPACTQFKDTCLDEAKKQGLQKVDFSIKYEAVVTSSANKLTKKADEATTKTVLKRIGWDEVENSLEKN